MKTARGWFRRALDWLNSDFAYFGDVSSFTAREQELEKMRDRVRHALIVYHGSSVRCPAAREMCRILEAVDENS
jgi:hypothetical protein